MRHPTYKKTTCQNCKIATVYSRGRCNTCYHYRLAHHGRERPAHLFQKHCSRCGSSPLCSRGLCSPCYEYQRTTGKPRPRHLFDPDAACRNPNCRRPLRLAPNAVAGYCWNCYVYRLRTGKPRPASLTGGPGPWCDCGQRATRRHTVATMLYGGRTPIKTVLDLCEDCYHLETSPTLVPTRFAIPEGVHHPTHDASDAPSGASEGMPKGYQPQNAGLYLSAQERRKIYEEGYYNLCG